MLTLIGGIVAIAVGVILINPINAGFGVATIVVVKGGVVILLVLGGLVAVASGISDIKDRIAEKKEKAEDKSEEEKKES